MSTPSNEELDFSQSLSALQSDEVWQYERCTLPAVPDLSHEVYRALQQPLEFPPMEAAIVPDDRVALAVDPNTPSVVEIIRGVLRAIRETDASGVDVVLWDEASDATTAAIQHEIGDATRVIRHVSSDRSSLRYLGADQDADPVYLDRRLVDADFVLPIAVGRPLDMHAAYDLTGIFPSFADSASRGRHRLATFAKHHADDEVAAHANELCWWLGVQMMLCAQANDHGEVGALRAGTPDAIRKELSPARPDDSQFPPPAPLVVASLDGGAQQQTWANAARAVAAATRYVTPGGTIVLWTNIEQPPQGCLLGLGADEPTDFGAKVQTTAAEDEFPVWDATNGIANTLQRVAADHRLLIRSRLPADSIELIGLAAIESEDELARLSRDFPECGVLRAAQFAGTTFDAETM